MTQASVGSAARKRKRITGEEVSAVRRRSERLNQLSAINESKPLGKKPIANASKPKSLVNGDAPAVGNEDSSIPISGPKSRKTKDHQNTQNVGSNGQVKKAKTKTRKEPSDATKQQASAKQKTSADTNTKPEEKETADDSDERPKYWLMKAEPETRIEKGKDVKFSIDDLKACTEPEPWTGVRNYAARNNMQNMRKGELAFFYHSNTKIPGIAGVCKVVDEATVDDSAFDTEDPYYDPKSDPEKPRWFCVKVEFVEKFSELVPLSVLQSHAKDNGPLSKMEAAVLRRAPSVSKVSKDQWEFVMGLVAASSK